MKGIELPINILVVVAVAVIVLLGVIALYFGGFMGPAQTMTASTAKSTYCAYITRHPDGCTVGIVPLNSITISNFDADQDGSIGASDTGVGWTLGTTVCGLPVAAGGDNLASLLQCHFGVTTERDGLIACGCAI